MIYLAISTMCYSSLHVEDICKCQKTPKKLLSESHKMIKKKNVELYYNMASHAYEEIVSMQKYNVRRIVTILGGKKTEISKH